MKFSIVVFIALIGNLAFSAEKISLSPGLSVTVKGYNADMEITCQGSKPLPTCTIVCVEAQTMGRQCDPYLVQIDGVTESKFTSLSGGLEAAKAEVADLKRRRICRR